jgi:hypothetical protein
MLLELELELIQIQMAQKPVLRAEAHARALRTSQNVKRAEKATGAVTKKTEKATRFLFVWFLVNWPFYK